MPHVDLLELPYFEGISLDDVISVVDTMTPQSFAAGDVIMREGQEMPPPLYIVTNGTARVSKKGPGGEQKVLAELQAPTILGEIELFCQIPAVATVEAHSKSSTFALTANTFERLFDERHPAMLRFTLNVARVTCHRLAIADEMLLQILPNEDLAALRRNVYGKMTGGGGEVPRTTGAFKIPEALMND